MNGLTMSNIDEITMRLVHYFITKENYQPIIVNGLDNEIWLENTERKYGVIRINTNYIHNNEQLDFDIFKTKSIMKQIKKKTLSFGTNILTILLNVGDNVNYDKQKDKHIFIEIIKDIEDLEKECSFTTIFPEIKDDVIDADTDIDFFINVTNDINETTEKKNKLYEKTFKKKNIVITYVLIAINILVFLLESLDILKTGTFVTNLTLVKHGEIYRIFTNAFFHGKDLIYLTFGMYSLFVLGKEMETFIGKWKFLAIYILSIIISSLLTTVIIGPNSIYYGSTGAIFGICGSLLYFGYHYRVFLGNVLTSQLIPIVILNLVLGFLLSGLNAFSYIGGLVGGIFSSMIVGIEGKTDKSDTINGIIVTTILIGFLLFMIYFK